MKFHVPVLLEESIKNLKIKKEGTYVDCTFGSGGHSREIISKLDVSGKLVSFDCDDFALNFFSDLASKENFFFIKDNFSNLKKQLSGLNIKEVDGFIFDLGLSSMQISDEDRGFSYREENSPLDMRMDVSNETTAQIIINSYKEKDLADIFYYFGEEHRSRRLAKSICNFRKKSPILKTGDLVRIITSSLSKKRKSKKHPARKIFQSLRIKVNNEIENLEKAIFSSIDMLSKKGGVLLVISYHSLEDKLIKNMFRDICKEKGEEFSCSKKPILPNSEEIKENNRSRSAKMRFLIRNKND